MISKALPIMIASPSLQETVDSLYALSVSLEGENNQLKAQCQSLIDDLRIERELVVEISRQALEKIAKLEAGK